MTELQEFLSMGGYGAYVWSAYAITFVVLALNILLAHREFKAVVKLAKRLDKTVKKSV